MSIPDRARGWRLPCQTSRRLAQVQLDDIAIGNDVIGTNLLPVEYAAAPQACELEIGRHLFVHQSRNIEHRRATAQSKRPGIIRPASSGLVRSG